MTAGNRACPVLLTLAILTLSCGRPADGPSTGVGDAVAQSGPKLAALKRVTATINGEPLGLSAKAGTLGVPGLDNLEELVSAGLSTVGPDGTLRAMLAEAVPTLENGQWTLLPDGRMEMTWKLRPGVFWHDGTAFTTADLAFTSRVVQDKELPTFGDVAYAFLEEVVAVDPHVVMVRWKRPYIDADTMFTRARAMPLPRHLLEQPFLEEKARFVELSYWSTDFVGSGPFVLKEWSRGSHMVLVANDRYVLGRPKIDEIHVSFIVDANVMAAHLLAGTVELTLGRTLAIDQAIDVRDRWQDGRMDFGYVSWIVIYPQFVNPDPPVVADLRFRRALLHALDRQTMAETIHGGLTQVAHWFIYPDQPQYRDIYPRIPQYDYNPRKAVQMIEETGYSQGSDGVFREPNGRRLELELRNYQGLSVDVKAMHATADYWQRVGVGGVQIIIVPQRVQDREYRANGPNFQLFQNPNDLQGITNVHSSRAPMRENEYRVTGNHSRYINAELDGLIDRYYATIPKPERTEVLGQIVYHIADQLPVMGLFYSTQPALISNRLQNVAARKNNFSVQTWNVHEWDVK